VKMEGVCLILVNKAKLSEKKIVLQIILEVRECQAALSLVLPFCCM